MIQYVPSWFQLYDSYQKNTWFHWIIIFTILFVLDGLSLNSGGTIKMLIKVNFTVGTWTFKVNKDNIGNVPLLTICWVFYLINWSHSYHHMMYQNNSYTSFFINPRWVIYWDEIPYWMHFNDSTINKLSSRINKVKKKSISQHLTTPFYTLLTFQIIKIPSTSQKFPVHVTPKNSANFKFNYVKKLGYALR